MPILVLAIVYLCVWGWREIVAVAPILALIAYFTLVHVALASSLRYRLPIEPFLIVLASVALARLARGWPVSRRAIEGFGKEAATRPLAPAAGAAGPTR